MHTNETDMREQILHAVRELIQSGTDINKITVRTIAGKAGVGVGLINYHFGSKDNLMEEVLAQIMAETAKQYLAQVLADETVTNRDKLKELIKSLYLLSVKYENIIKFLIIRCLQRGDMGAEMSILPILKQIFGEDRNEIEIRIMAMQIIKPIQAAGLCPGSFRVYSGFDLYDEKQREKFVDLLTDNLI